MNLFPHNSDKGAPVNGLMGLTRVLENDLCVGCGICAGLWPQNFRMDMNHFGQYQPTLQAGSSWDYAGSKAAGVCPFSGEGDNEDILGRQKFGFQKGIKHSGELGFFLSTHAAWVTDKSDRLASSAGGVTTWLLKHLLQNHIVDGVVCVAQAISGGKLFEYRIIRKVEEFGHCRKSKYYPVELSRVIPELNSMSGRFAVVALPCFIKGLRMAAQAGLIAEEKIYCVAGLFCGHLKTTQFAAYLIRSCGFHENTATDVDFRKKLAEEKASDYAFEATVRTESGAIEQRSVRMKDIQLGNWGLNAFMMNSCECCDDVVAELADISFGDAWLPEFVRDSRGTNIVICRREDIKDILVRGAASGELHLRPLDPEAIVRSQDGSFRQRRQALAYRLYLAGRNMEWRPPKRVLPACDTLRLYSKMIQWIRIKLAQKSKVAFYECQDKDNLKYFSRRMALLVSLHNVLYLSRKTIKSFIAGSGEGIENRK